VVLPQVATTGKPQALVVLDPGGNDHFDRAIDGGNLNLSTQHGFAGGNRQCAVDVVSFEAELVVGADVDVQVEVTAVVPLLSQANALAGHHAGGEVDFQSAFSQSEALAAPFVGLLEGEVEAGFDVARGIPGFGAGFATAGKTLQELVNKVLEIEKTTVIKFGRSTWGRFPLKSLLLPVLTKAIVFGALLAVGKHLVGFADEFEPFLSGFVSGVEVWVVTACQLSVGAFDFGQAGVAVNP
jgi:hypothetical protein